MLLFRLENIRRNAFQSYPQNNIPITVLETIRIFDMLPFIMANLILRLLCFLLASKQILAIEMFFLRVNPSTQSSSAAKSGIFKGIQIFFFSSVQQFYEPAVKISPLVSSWRASQVHSNIPPFLNLHTVVQALPNQPTSYRLYWTCVFSFAGWTIPSFHYFCWFESCLKFVPCHPNASSLEVHPFTNCVSCHSSSSSQGSLQFRILS